MFRSLKILYLNRVSSQSFTLRRCFSEIRKNEQFMKELMDKNTTRYVLFNRLLPVVTKCTENESFQLISLSNEQITFINNDTGIKVYVGNNNPQFGVSFSNIKKENLLELLKDKFDIDAHYITNPFGYLKLSQRDIDIWIKLRGLYSWHYSNLFCGQCGSATESVESGYKRVCMNSKCLSKNVSKGVIWTNYPRIDPVISVLPVISKDPENGLPACLLARKEIFPPNLMSCITGFIDPGESAETAAVRELKEELNLECEYLIYQTSEYWPIQSSLFLGFIAEVPALSQFHLDNKELSHAQWFNFDQVNQLLNNKHSMYIVPPRSTIMYRLIEKWVVKNMHLS